MKNFIMKYKHAWVFSYMLLYFVWFFALEQRGGVPMTVIHTPFDNLIPFNEFFYIPYVLWFLYIPAVVLYFFFTSKKDFFKICIFLFTGMTICLIIYTLWPNCQNLRPLTFERDNFFVDCVQRLYGFDTSTNVCPSIHVFNSIGAHIAIRSSEKLKNKKWLRFGSFVLASLICLSTVFLKQHSIIDGLCAVSLACVLYFFVYYLNYSAMKERRQARKDIAFH
ncbi:MAG: phosphatase PAP2 family protein [Acetivibrio sp.]